ncbi:hypothetical protein [Thermococcus sp. MV11]|uniref:hypothetical protein n=1 Tax=Thermococcus sp. MV11 TaxID=1638267 RepID=UPI00142FA7C3|nr:hypothetical protein [Thermococcus sp. MV11]NJE03021.1 hypothetical protein [Thermococcus sp. MV11]
MEGSGSSIGGFLMFIALAIIGVIIGLGLLLFAAAFLVVLVPLIVILLVVGAAKGWWKKRHPPKELESPEDYF